MKDLLAYLFRDSQLESEAEATREAIEQIMEEAETQEPLKTKRTPLLQALKTIGLGDVDSEMQYDPEGFSLHTDDEMTYKDWVRLLMEPDAMEKLAEMGWVVTRCGDKAQINEPPEFRVRFLEIHFVNNDEQEPDRGSWPAPNPELVKKSVEKGREFMSTPLDRDHDELNPVEHPEAPNKKHAGMKDAKDGKDPEGKPKTGKSKSEALLREYHEPDAGDSDEKRSKSKRHPKEKCGKCGKLGDECKCRPAPMPMRYGGAHVRKSESQALVDSLLGEGGHAAGCQCGFCKNKGSFGKKKADTEEKADAESEGGSDEDSMGEAISECQCPKCHGTDTVTDEGKQHLCRTCGFEFIPVSQESQEPKRYDDVYESMGKKKKLTQPKQAGKVPKAFKTRRIK